MIQVVVVFYNARKERVEQHQCVSLLEYSELLKKEANGEVVHVIRLD